MKFYSDRQNGLQQRINETISKTVWDAIVVEFNNLIVTGAFGYKFPEVCSDIGANAVIGTDVENLKKDLNGRVSLIGWPLDHQYDTSWDPNKGDKIPDTIPILDFIEYCHRSIGKPEKQFHHSSYQHDHLRFDVEQGQYEFRESVNELFSRNKIAYELDDSGIIKRLTDPVISKALNSPLPASGDSTLDQMLSQSCTKFINPDKLIRKEALDLLWDCFERLKTIDGPNKKLSIQSRILAIIEGPKFQDLVTNECKILTDIGNCFHIRHTETDKEQIQTSQQIDYFYHRLFCLIVLLLKNDR